MTTQPDDAPVDDYPQAWRPPERVDLDEAAQIAPLAVEQWLASASPAELQATLARARGNR